MIVLIVTKCKTLKMNNEYKQICKYANYLFIHHKPMKLM